MNVAKILRKISVVTLTFSLVFVLPYSALGVDYLISPLGYYVQQVGSGYNGVDLTVSLTNGGLYRIYTTVYPNPSGFCNGTQTYSFRYDIIGVANDNIIMTMPCDSGTGNTAPLTAEYYITAQDTADHYFYWYDETLSQVATDIVGYMGADTLTEYVAPSSSSTPTSTDLDGLYIGLGFLIFLYILFNIIFYFKRN